MGCITTSLQNSEHEKRATFFLVEITLNDHSKMSVKIPLEANFIQLRASRFHSFLKVLIMSCKAIAGLIAHQGRGVNLFVSEEKKRSSPSYHRAPTHSAD